MNLGFIRAGIAAVLSVGLAISFVAHRLHGSRVSKPGLVQADDGVRSTAFAPSNGGATSAGGMFSARRDVPPVSIAALPMPAAGPMPRESAIAGVVLDAIGGPIPGARISARALDSEPAANAISADSGEFRLRLPVGSWQLSVEAEGYARASEQLYSPSTGARLLLSPESAIVGRVVSRADRLPVAGVTVTTKKSDGPPYCTLSTVSDERGAFELRQLPAGTHHLLAVSPHFRGETVSVDLGAAHTISAIELEVTGATTVRGAIQMGGAACASGTLEMAGPIWLSSAADAGGEVEAHGVLPGSYELTVTCPSALPFRALLLVGDRPISRIWELESGVVVRGSVETSAGRPLADAVITWTRRETVMQDRAEPARPASESSCTSDVHGEFSCSGLEPGHYDGALYVQGKLQSAAPDLYVQGSHGPARIQLRADPSGTIRVDLDDGTHAPPASVAVLACNQQGEVVLAERDGQSFVLEGLPLGTYGLHVGAPECTRGMDALVELERDGQVAAVTLPRPRLARVRGRLVDSDGAPVPDAWVRASDAHPAWARLIESAPAVMTDADGEFSLSGLFPGRYELLAQGTLDGGAARQSVDLASGDEVELELTLMLER